MCVVITIDPRDPDRDRTCDDAKFWSGNCVLSGWRVREDENWDLRTQELSPARAHLHGPRLGKITAPRPPRLGHWPL
jgi:hypothetical protein